MIDSHTHLDSCEPPNEALWRQREPFDIIYEVRRNRIRAAT